MHCTNVENVLLQILLISILYNLTEIFLTFELKVYDNQKDVHVDELYVNKKNNNTNISTTSKPYTAHPIETTSISFTATSTTINGTSTKNTAS